MLAPDLLFPECVRWRENVDPTSARIFSVDGQRRSSGGWHRDQHSSGNYLSCELCGKLRYECEGTTHGHAGAE